MKRGILLSAFLCLAAITVLAQKTNYIIVGTAPDLEGVKIIMYNMENGVHLDSTMVINGKFQLKGHTDTSILVNVNSGDRRMVMVLLLQPGSHLTIDAATATVKGNRPSEQLNQMAQEINTLHDKQQRVARQCMAAEEQMEKDSLMNLYDAYTLRITNFVDSVCWKLYEANADNKAGAEILLNIAHFLTKNKRLYFEEPTPSILRLLSTYAEASPVIQNYPTLRKIIQQITVQIEIKPGASFRDFKAVDYTTGKQTTLGAIISGHVAVVDFWASWCGPCRKEIEETLKPLYKEYANRGLMVVGVDVWDKVENHDKAVKELGITYPQLIDTDRNNSSLLYGFNSIPFVILIDRDGTILGIFRGEELVQEVEKALKIEK
jgi:thiol-disulfide isomerase/thioredoxin